MKNHKEINLVFIGFWISSCIFSNILLTRFSIVQSLDDLAIRSKFEPWLWDKVQDLEANGTTRFMTICLGINCRTYKHNLTAAYEFRAQVATRLVEEHNATILYIGRLLSFVNIKIRVPEVREIAAYEFVDGLGDGEAIGTCLLDVSKATIRSSMVVNELGYNGSTIRVAVLDAGINASHPDFAGKNIIWEDFTPLNKPDPYDDFDGHGTHCAGIIAGTGQAYNESVHACEYRGVAPGVTDLIIGKILPNLTEEIALKALDWAANNQCAHVISCSWGFVRKSPCDGRCQLCNQTNALANLGIVVVAGAGNEGHRGSRTIRCPGAASGVITVGAIVDTNTESVNDDHLLTNSSRGPTGDGRSKPDVVAPGWDIMSPDVGGGYSNFSYTSAATPHVAGVAALILQKYDNWIWNEQYVGAVKGLITQTARLNDNLQALTENDRGKGIVDAERAVTWDPPFEGILGPGNPGFEKRILFAPGVSGEPYWLASGSGWRDVKGDVNGDKICDISDLYAIGLAFGYPCDPNWDSDCDLNGDRIVDISDLYLAANDYGKEANCKDGSYSWYTSGSGGYNMTQWLCYNDVHDLKGEQVTFSFWFKPDGTGNNATAKIHYITETGQQIINGSWVYAAEGWHNANITTTLPTNTIAIQVIIHLTANYATWIDKATIETS